MSLLNMTTGKIFKYSRLILSIVCFIIFIFITMFLYKNFYKIITQSEEVMILQREVAIEDINMNNFDKIIERLKKKIEPRTIKLDINF